MSKRIVLEASLPGSSLIEWQVQKKKIPRGKRGDTQPVDRSQVESGAEDESVVSNLNQNSVTSAVAIES